MNPTLRYAKDVRCKAQELMNDVSEERRKMEQAIADTERAIDTTEEIAHNISQCVTSINNDYQRGHDYYNQSLNIHHDITQQYSELQYVLNNESALSTLTNFQMAHRYNYLSKTNPATHVNHYPEVNLQALQYQEKYWNEMSKDIQLLEDQFTEMFAKLDKDLQAADGLAMTRTSTKPVNTKQPKRITE